MPKAALAFTVAGVGSSFLFPFGVAILASVFAHQGQYGTPQTFLEGFAAALWVAVPSRPWASSRPS